MNQLTLSRPRFASLLGLALASTASLAHAQSAAPAPATAPATAPAAAEAPSAPAATAPTGIAIPLTPAEASAAKAATPTPADATGTDASQPAAPAAAPDAKNAEADAEAAAIEAEIKSGGGNDAGSEFKLNIYGFADFTYSNTLTTYTFGNTSSSFYVGKLNLYAAADLGDDWRSLAEIRFMYLPNGNTPFTATGPGPRTDTTAGDYSDLNRPIRWGGISIERAWLEHTFHPLLTVRAGQWLTPYGIWNVDHGSPVIIGARRPFIVGEALFPERQTGIEVYGGVGFGPSQVGYHLTLSNGRGPVDTYQDLDNNKAIGGRLFFKHDTEKFGAFTVGTSFYRGKYTDANDTVTFTASGLGTVHNVTARYEELSLAADAKWEWDGLLVQSEVITNQVAYPEGHRVSDPGFSGGPPGFSADFRKIGVYGIAGYRFPFLGIMPFFGGEYYDPGLTTFNFKAAAFWGGINSRPTPRVVLKAQLTHAWLLDFPDNGKYNGLDLQAAWSF